MGYDNRTKKWYCDTCGTSFEGKRRNAKYCSQKCRQIKYVKDNPEKRKETVDNYEKRKKNES